jgi:hypothetical protein
VKTALAAISRSKTWDVTMRIVGVSCLMFLGAAAFAAAVGTVRQLAAGGNAARLVATLAVNICLLVLLLIEATLIASRSWAVAKAPDIRSRMTALIGTWLIFVVVFLLIRVDLPI